MSDRLISNTDIVISANAPISPGGAVDDSGGDIIFKTSDVERSRIKADGTPGGLISAALLPYGQRVVFLGDSITSAQSNETLADQARWSISFPTYASYASNGKLVRYRNAGVPGNKAADMLARFDVDVTPYAPTAVVIMAGTNDWNDSGTTTLANYAATIKALVGKCQAIRALPILATVPPNIVSSARRSRTILGNAWLRRYCALNGIPLWDAYNILVDPSTGDYLAAYGSASNDKTHPINPGYVALGQDLATFFATLGSVSPIYSLLPQDNGDANNLVANGLFLTTTGSAGTLMPTSWSVQAGSHVAGVTGSLVTGDTAIKGNWWKVVADGTATTTENEFQTLSGIIPGHLYAHVGRFKATGLRNADSGSGSQVLVGAAFNSTLNNALYDFREAGNISYDVAAGAFYHEMLAPSDASTLLVRHQLLNTTAGAGTLQVAQRGVYDLTALGLDGSI
jgi:lysophospholipase L1-like esterase